MKKFLMAGLAVILMSSFASAQLGPIGVKAGMNLADLGGDVEESDMKAGLVVGGFANFGFGNISIQPELLYSMKGAKQEIGGEDISTDYNYFEVPVLVKYNLPMPGALTPSIYAGPVFSLLLSAESDGEDVKEQLKNNDYGIIIGAGANMDLQSYVLTFDARYNLGLNDINDVSGSDFEIKNSAIMVMVGLGFNLPGM